MFPLPTLDSNWEYSRALRISFLCVYTGEEVLEIKTFIIAFGDMKERLCLPHVDVRKY